MFYVCRVVIQNVSILSIFWHINIMRGIILLNAGDNTNQVEEEEKLRFTKDILDNVGIPMDDIWDDEDKLSIAGKIRLRNILSSYGVTIVDDMEGGLKIYHEREIIAEWSRPLYILKRDYDQIDPMKKMYLEMHIDCTSIFEDENK